MSGSPEVRKSGSPDNAASPAALAWARFWEQPSSRWGTALVALVVLMAVYAPFLCSEVALVWWDGDGLHFPLLADLFNRRSYPKYHDLAFNVAALLLPLLVIVGVVLRQRLSWTRRIGGGAALILLVWILSMVPLIPTTHGWTALWSNRPDSPATIQTWQAHNDATRPFAVFPPVPHRVDATYAGAILKSPGTVNTDTGHRFWLGTDSVGHDVFAILCFGARISLTVGLVATGIAFVIGILIGALSGYLGGWVDLLLQRAVEIMMCFPTFILVLTVVAMLERDIFIIMAVIGLTGWAGTARLVRGEFLAQGVRDYVLAAQALGLPRWRIMFCHILPNTLAPLLISATFAIAGSVGAEGGLAFLGLGDPTTPSWGVLMEQGRQNIRYPWLIYVPGLALFMLVMVLNLLGNNLRNAVDPKHAK
jgi:peptide/nickel transport system permease protein